MHGLPCMVLTVRGSLHPCAVSDSQFQGSQSLEMQGRVPGKPCGPAVTCC